MTFSHAWVLWLLPLTLLAWLPSRSHELRNTFAAQLPPDRGSIVLQWTLRLVELLAVAAVIVAMSDPYRPEDTIERVGQGAEIVLVLDRSRSMDQGFAGVSGPAPARSTGPEALDYYSHLNSSGMRDPKGHVARRLLADFAAKRRADRFGMVVFSTVPMRVLDFTQKQEVIQAAIAAGNIGRGLSETNIGLALEAGLSFFENRPYAGARIVLLVSDGGDQLDPDAREQIRQMVHKYRVAIDWIYLRSVNSPGLMQEQVDDQVQGTGDAAAGQGAVPEHALHRFFESLGTPYRAYEAENPAAMQRAIDDLDRLDNLPIVYHDVVPRRELSGWASGTALLCVLVLLLANGLEIKRWA